MACRYLDLRETGRDRLRGGSRGIHWIVLIKLKFDSPFPPKQRKNGEVIWDIVCQFSGIDRINVTMDIWFGQMDDPSIQVNSEIVFPIVGSRNVQWSAG